MAALGVARTAWHALALMAFAGLLNGFFHVNTITLLQKGTPEELRGRVFGVLHTLVLGLAPVAMGLAGVAADALDQNVRLLFEVCGGVLLVTAGVAAASPELRAFLAHESR
jgi:DHA3 family macrolide efflux protein-like MFS transporter